MMGRFADEFSDTPGTDFSREFTRDFFLTASQYWLDEHHVDGFRYNYAPGIFDGSTGSGYANLVYRTPDSRSATHALMPATGEAW